MSAVGPNVADIGGAIAQMIDQSLRSAYITSPRFDDYKITATDINQQDFSEIINEAIRINVIRYMEDQGIISGGIGGTDKEEEEGGLTAKQGVGLAEGAIARMQNPAMLVAEGLGMLPQAVLISFAISLMPIIINELTKPGGPFDLRFKRIMEQEFNALQDRQTMYDVRVGNRGIIVQAAGGRLSHNQHGVTNANTLRTVKNGGIDKSYMNQIDYVDHAKGLF